MKKFEPPARRRPVETDKFQRILGHYGDPREGPTVIFIGGIHGNEPAGVVALNNVFRQLEAEQPSFNGSAHALAGNLKALKQRKRFIDIDLNRTWTPERDLNLQHIQPLELEGTNEAKEQSGLLDAFRNIVRTCKPPFYVLDFHTVSSDSVPFINFGDTLRNRHFARQFPLPTVLGLEELLHGTFLNFANEHGFVCFGFEAGQHDDPDSVENNEALIWHTFTVTENMDEADIDGIEDHRQQLLNASFGHDSVFELRYRYAISEGEQFRMKPGFKNFDPVKKGQVIAENKEGEIQSPESGRIFMPLYQKQGADGFFIVRSFKPFWLKVSAWMRRAKLDRLLPYLPGIRSHSRDRDTLIIKLRIALWYVVELLHLLGYRRERKEDRHLIVTKRKYDVHPPDNYFPDH